MKQLFILLMLLSQMAVTAQRFDMPLMRPGKLLTVEEAEKRLKTAKNTVTTPLLEDEERNAEWLEWLIDYKPGEIFIAETVVCRVDERGTTNVSECDMFAFQTKSFSKPQIDSLRNLVVQQYNAGKTHNEIYESYIKNTEAEAYIEWRSVEGKKFIGFDLGTASRKVGEIYFDELPEQGIYFVLIKTKPSVPVKYTLITSSNMEEWEPKFTD